MKLKLKIIIFSLVITLIPLYSAFAAEAVFEGEVTAQGQLVHVNGNEAKFNEYTDRKDGIYGAIGLRYEQDSYFMRFNAYDIGYDTQKYTLDGGMWGKFKYDLFYNEIPHNITFGAKTFYSGVGDSSLKIKGDPDNVSTWHSFDYGTERKRFGGGVKLDLLKPFFLDISAQTEKKEGIKPAGGGGFSGPFELPEPIDYRTDTFKVEAGYSKKPFFASLSYFYSKFENDNQNLDFVIPDPLFGPVPDSITLPPDNKYYKVAFKGAVFLPLNSKFSVNAGTARAKSEGDANNIIAPPVDRFRGKVDTDNVDLVLTSNPVSFLDGRLFYKYYDRDNRSEDVEDNLSWIDRSYGGQFVFKLPASFRLTAGYTNKHTTYEDRFDARKRTDDIYSADLAWSGLDFAVFRVGYEKLHRSNQRNGTDAAADGDIFWRFDVAPADRDTFKASVDLFPVDNLSVTLGYKYKKTDYEDRRLDGRRSLGLREDKRDEFFVDASYSLAKYAQLYGYLDYEKLRSQQVGYRQGDGDYWDLSQKEKNIDYGIGTDIYIIPKKLTLKLQYDYVKSDGKADFTLQTLPAGFTNSNVDIRDWDDYRKKAFSARAVYDVMKSVSVTAGYVYEQFKLEDIQLEGYQYVIDGARLTGAYKAPNYKANIVFLALTYRF